MSKHLLEDMVNIPRAVLEETEAKHSPNRFRYLLWLVAIFSVAFFLFALSFLFGRAEISVAPKTEDLTLGEDLSAAKDSNSNGLFFNLVAVPGQMEKTITAAGQKEAQNSATGTVVFNSFSSAPQPLAVDTRLEGSNGKLYKTETKIIVPGKAKDGTPGQAEANIYASAPGAEYNSPPLDFKIVGFAGTAKYAKIIGRSKTGTDITGGFVGLMPDVSEADKLVAMSELKNALQTKLLSQVTVPDGFVLFKGAIFIETDDAGVVSTYNQDNSLTLTENGVLYGILFDEKKLTQKIAQDNIPNYDGSDIYIPNIQNLIFTLSSQNNPSFDTLQNINFSLSGPVKIVWKLDVDKFIADLLGKSKKDFSQILTQYPGIESATLKLSPFWKFSIPDKSKDVKVIVNYPQN